MLETESPAAPRLAVRQLLSKLFDIIIEEGEISAVSAGMETETILYSPGTPASLSDHA
jgi:hypothetical protein